MDNAGITLFEREALIQGQEKCVEPRIVLQIDPYGCGVACLAMVVEVEYTAARSIFDKLGLNAPKRKDRKPYSSNFKELRAALLACGYPSKVRRFTSWSTIGGPCIVKVHGVNLRNSHWVYANRTNQYGLYILDPALPVPYIEKMPLDVLCVELDIHQPYGCYIEIQM